MRVTLKAVYVVLVILLMVGCEEQTTEKAKPSIKEVERVAPKEEIQYSFSKPKEYFKENQIAGVEKEILSVINRADSVHLLRMDSILVPSDYSADIAYYLPFPFKIEGLQDIDKIIFFSYPTQSFGAYENGQLVYAGPTNMGRKADPTPNGLFFTNWKAEKTISTFNDEWELKWNFNIQNKEGIGWHEYAMPGYPASHSCLRLLEKDARYLYKWADQWILEGTDSIKQKGTPVIVFGDYPFEGKKPWLELVNNPHVLDIDAKELEQKVKPYWNEIITAQKDREPDK